MQFATKPGMLQWCLVLGVSLEAGCWDLDVPPWGAGSAVCGASVHPEVVGDFSLSTLWTLLLLLAEQMELGFLAGVAPFRVKQVLGDVEQECGGPHVAEMLKIHVHALAYDAGIVGDRRSDDVWGEFEDGILVELGCEALLGQIDAITFDAREANFERVALGSHSLDLNRFARRLGRRDDGLGREVEGNAEHIGVFDIEQAVLVEVVGLAAQGASDDLLAQELRAEGADAENVRDGVRIPTFREHRDRDDAADGAAKLSGSLGWRTRRRSLMVRPGAQTRKPRVNCLLDRRRTALIVCQAMSITITVVLPAPVASFSAKRRSSGLASLLALAM